MTSAAEQRHPRPFSFDVNEMAVDENGVKNFFWPVSYAERHAFDLAIMRAYADFVRQYDEPAGIMAPYMLIGKYYINEVVGVLIGDLLRDRFAAAGYEPALPERMQNWRALFARRVPEPMDIIAQMQNAPGVVKAKPSQKYSLKRLKRILSLLQFKKGGLEVDGLKVRPITSAVLKNNIIATQRLPLVCKHAEAAGEDVVFCRSDKWFQPVSDEELKQSAGKSHKEFEEAIIDATARFYKEYAGATLEAHSRAYLEGLLRDGAAVMRVHYERLLAMKPEDLPRRIWTGSGGTNWDTLLRLVVKERGGFVCGHDHGAGQGHADNPFMGLMEFWGCHEFMTFNKNHASELTKRAPSWCLYEKELPKVTGLDPSASIANLKIFPRYQEKDFKVKTVMVMVEQFDGDRGRAGACSQDIVLMDWHLRLFAKLRSWGYADIIAKVHPESPLMPPAFYEEQFGVRVITTPFEKVMTETDLVIADYIFTTPFRTIMETNIPYVMVDFYDHPLTKKGWELLEKRGSIVHAGYDEYNRRQVDWDVLKAAIESAPQKIDNHEFFDFYYA